MLACWLYIALEASLKNWIWKIPKGEVSIRTEVTGGHMVAIQCGGNSERKAS